MNLLYNPSCIELHTVWIDLRLFIMKPLHAQWILSVYDKLKVKLAGMIDSISSAHALFNGRTLIG